MATGGHTTPLTFDSDYQCKPCGSEGKSRPADVHCVTCGQYQCVQCSNVHTLFQFMSGHDIQSIQHKGQGHGSKKGLKTCANDDKLKLCTKHRKALDVYCCSHNEMCCSVCTVEDHGRCRDRRAIEEYASDAPIEPGKVGSKIKSLKTKLHQIRETIISRKTDIDRKMDKLHFSISNTRACVATKIILYGHSIVTKARQQGLNSKATLEMACKQIETVLDNCQKLYVRYKLIYINGTHLDCFKAHTNFISDVRTYTMVLRESNVSVTNISVGVNRQLSMVLGDRNQFVVYATKHTSHGCSNSEITIPLMTAEIKVVDLRQALNTPKGNGLVSVGFLSDNRIVALDQYNNLVILLDTNLSVIGRYSMDKATIFDGAVLPSDELVVAHLSGFSTFLTILSAKNDVITVCKSIKTVRYESVCVVNSNTLIASHAVDENVAEKIDITTSVVTRFSENIPKKKWKFGDETSYVEYINSKKKLVVTHRRENKIDFWPIYDSASVKTVTGPNIKRPRGMCVGPMDCVFVCCYDSHKVVQITHDAHIVCCYSMTNLLYPMAVSISNDHSKMVVTSDLQGRSIGIFTLQNSVKPVLRINNGLMRVRILHIVLR